MRGETCGGLPSSSWRVSDIPARMDPGSSSSMDEWTNGCAWEERRLGEEGKMCLGRITPTQIDYVEILFVTGSGHYHQRLSL